MYRCIGGKGGRGYGEAERSSSFYEWASIETQSLPSLTPPSTGEGRARTGQAGTGGVAIGVGALAVWACCLPVWLSKHTSITAAACRVTGPHPSNMRAWRQKPPKPYGVPALDAAPGPRCRRATNGGAAKVSRGPRRTCDSTPVAVRNGTTVARPPPLFFPPTWCLPFAPSPNDEDASDRKRSQSTVPKSLSRMAFTSYGPPSLPSESPTLLAGIACPSHAGHAMYRRWTGVRHCGGGIRFGRAPPTVAGGFPAAARDTFSDTAARACTWLCSCPACPAWPPIV